MTTATKQTNTRHLPPWGVTANTSAGIARLRGLIHYTETDIDILDELLEQSETEGADEHRTWLNTFIEDSELQALMRGDSFSIGQVIARACVFGSGNKIHLQLQRASAAAIGLLSPLETLKHPALEGFCDQAPCRTHGNLLQGFDDQMFTTLTTTTQAAWGRAPRSTQLSCEEALELICEVCLSDVHMAGMTQLCPHNQQPHTCRSCVAKAEKQECELREKRWAAVRTVRVLVGDVRTAAALRKHPQFKELQGVLRAQLHIDDRQELARALGWHTHTLTSIL